MTASQLCVLDDCRILHFMIHDRVSFGGVLVAIGVLYLWLVRFPLRQGESWAWWALALSSAAGLRNRTLSRPRTASHPIRSCGTRPPIEPRDWTGTAALDKRGDAIAGLIIMIVGMTRVFVPQDLAFMGMTRDALRAVNPRLVPLIAHDRAGFGGALVSFAVAMFGWVWCARPSQTFLKALTIAGVAGFGTTVGVHHAIGYTSLTHLGPAVLACVVFGLGLVLAARASAPIPE